MGVSVCFSGALILYLAIVSVQAGDGPTFTSPNMVYVDENKAKDSTILTVTASPALGVDRQVAIKGNGTCMGPNNVECGAGTDVSAMFNLNMDTGVLTNKMMIDYEKYRKFMLTIRLYNPTTPNADIATQVFTINIRNVDEKPVFNTNSLMASFSEKKMEGAMLLMVTATDPEGDAVTLMTGTQVNPNLMLESDGKVKVATGKTLEVPAAGKKTVYSMDVKAKSGNPAQTASAVVTITINGPPMNGSAMMTGSVLAIVVSLFLLFV